MIREDLIIERECPYAMFRNQLTQIHFTRYQISQIANVVFKNKPFSIQNSLQIR